MDKKDLKLVDYTGSSSSSDDKEKIKFPYPKIAVVNPMQIVTPEIITDVPEHDETTEFEHDETTEFDPDVSLTRQPIPHQVTINLNKSEEKVKFLNLRLLS